METPMSRAKLLQKTRKIGVDQAQDPMMSKYDEAVNYLAAAWTNASPQARAAGFAELKRRGLTLTDRDHQGRP